MNKKFLIDTISHLPDDAEIYVAYEIPEGYYETPSQEYCIADSISVSLKNGKGCIVFNVCSD